MYINIYIYEYIYYGYKHLQMHSSKDKSELGQSIGKIQGDKNLKMFFKDLRG